MNSNMIVGPDGTTLRPVAGATIPTSGFRLETGDDCTRASSSSIPPRVAPRAAPVVPRAFLATSLPRHHLKAHKQNTDTSTTAEEACETGAAGRQYSSSECWMFLGSSSKTNKHMALRLGTKCEEHWLTAHADVRTARQRGCIRDC